MNATSLYVSTCRLVLQADVEDSSSWTDLFRLVPYLRQSLSCTVCGNLLIEPYTPTETNCQHHVCRSCKGGKKKLKPSCSWCKNYDKYVENVQLRILLQCYKKLCEYVTSTAIYRTIFVSSTSNGTSCDGSSSLVDLIQEGAGFKDDFKSTAGLSKSAYSILPCVYTSTSTQTQTALASSNIVQAESAISLQTMDSQGTRNIPNGSSLYSVMYPGPGNKITIKRKATDLDDEIADSTPCNSDTRLPVINGISCDNGQIAPAANFKKPMQRVSSGRSSGRGALSGGATKRKGCRCGNATATPGKLTCCGQRCPCYVESKACIECRCRGCRNPHRPGGRKVRPMIPELQNYQLHLGQSQVKAEFPDRDPLSLTALSNSSVQVLGVYADLQNIPSTLPATLLLGDDNTHSTESSADETSDVDVDI